MKIAITAAICCLIYAAAFASDQAPDVWKDIRVGLPIDRVTELLRGDHGHASLSRPDGTGYKKFWPVDRNVIANEIERAFFPHGHVIIIEFDREGIVTEISRTFISEEDYAKSLSTIQKKD